MISMLRAQPPKLVLPVGHTKPIISARFSPDNKKVLTLSADGTAKLWDAATGFLLKDFVAGGDASIAFVTSAIFSPDGQHIIAGYDSEYSAIWGLNSGEPIWDWVYNAHDAPVNTIQDHISPNGKRILFFDTEDGATVYNIANKKPLFRLQGNSAKLNLACYSKDGKWIAAASTDNVVGIYVANTGKLLIKRKFQAESINAIRFSPDQKLLYIFTINNSAGNSENNLYSIDVATGKISLQAVYYPSGDIDVFRELSARADLWFSYSEPIPDDSTFSETYPDTAFVWQTKSGKYLYDLLTLSKQKNPVFFARNGQKIVTIHNDNKVVIRDAASGKMQMELSGHLSHVNVVRFSPDEKIISTGSDDSTVHLWDAATGQMLGMLKGHSGGVTEIGFSSDGKKMLTGSKDKTVIVWDLKTRRQTALLTTHIRAIDHAKFSADGNRIIIYSGKMLKTWNRETGILTHELSDTLNAGDWIRKNKAGMSLIRPDSSYQINWAGNVINIFPIKEESTFSDIAFGMDVIIKDIQLHPKENKMLVLTEDNNVKIYDIDKETFTGSFLFLDSTDYILQVPSGYYQGTPSAAKRLLYTTHDLQVISFEQLDVKYNRPDIVLQTMGHADSNVIKMNLNAYAKRIKKLGIDTAAFRDGYSVPRADITNRNALSEVQLSEKLLLHIKASDSSYLLDRLNIWVNEVPVFGSKGKSVRQNRSKKLDFSSTVILSEGVNRIETSITNVNGTESYRMPLIVNYTPPSKQKITTYFIGIGIDQFTDTSYNLNYSVKDIRDLSAKLKQQYGNDIIIDTLFNENVTVSNVKALKQKLKNTTVNDKVLISYSGHGLLSKDYDYFLSTYSVNFKNPAENGLPYDEFESLLDSIPARKKLMLIDACHSGEVDKEEFRQVKISQSTLAANHVVSKGGEISESEEGSQKLGLKNSFELMQNLFVNVGKSTGATIISAAAGTEFALENGNLKNGVFTYCIMEAMDKYPTMKVSELKKVVGARVQELTNGMQKPTSRNEAIAVDWNVW